MSHKWEDEREEVLRQYLTPEERKELDRRIEEFSEFMATLVLSVKARVEKWPLN